MISVRPGSPFEPEAEALLHDSHTLMHSLFPAEANHFLSLDALTAPDIRFFVAEIDGRIVGTAALAIKDGYGEVKSMFVAPAARGSGAGAALVDRLESEARTRGLTELKLETGSTLDAAHRLYARQGFTSCGPFGAYPESPHSRFMEKHLT